MYYYHHQNYYYYNQNDAYRRHHHPYQNPSYHRRHHHPYQNPSYHRHQNPSYYHQSPSYHHHHHQNLSYYDQNYAYHRRHHQHHHQNSSYDQIPHHHHHHQQQQQHHRNRFYDQNLSDYHRHQQQRHCRNRIYDQIEALPHCAASNPTRLLVAKVKPKAKAPVVVDFPVDVLILILARLPTKTLLKFRCVCKSWNSLIQQDHHFISLHQLHLNDNKKLPPLVRMIGTYRPPPNERLDWVLNYSSSSSDTMPYKFDFTRLQQDPIYCITNSCNGLLGVYSRNNFFIVNPTIRRLRLLPRPTPPCSLSYSALGFDASTGVYKVVRIFEREYEGIRPVRFGCEVYYLGGSGGWKMIDDPPVQPSYVSLPVIVDGAIIWASEISWKKHLEVVALSFDLREEKFSVILHPEGSSRSTFPDSHKSHVFASGGCICVADEITSPVSSAHMNIWLLTKNDKNNISKWVKQYVIDLTYVLKRVGLFCKAEPLTTDHNGRIVISWGQGRKDYYDPRTRSFDKHELDAHVYVEYVAPYTESMVWPWPRL